MNNTFTAKAVVNRIVRTYVLNEVPTGEHLKADMLKRGWDGTSWIGTSAAEGRKKELVALFFRDTKGNFSIVG